MEHGPLFAERDAAGGHGEFLGDEVSEFRIRTHVGEVRDRDSLALGDGPDVVFLGDNPLLHQSSCEIAADPAGLLYLIVSDQISVD